jgi:hypothetical protein
MPISLLNLDQEQDRDLKEIEKAIYEEIQNISDLVVNQDASQFVGPKLMILRNRVKDLQNSLAEFGELTEIPTMKKQQMILEIHPLLQNVSNSIFGIDETSDKIINTCVSFLLTHLVYTAAANPKSVVIGVSNVLAQVLSQEIGVTECPVINTKKDDPAYFDEFQVNFNYVLTSAGLFAAPVIGLPDISISALGNWADLAISQFGYLREFTIKYFDPEMFYKFDKLKLGHVPFDSTKDILTAILFENEFLYQLSSRADLLSGLEVPPNFGLSTESIKLMSAEEVTKQFCLKIIENCNFIDEKLKIIYEMFNRGKINRNDDPKEDERLIEINQEINAWALVAEFGVLVNKILSNKTLKDINYQPKSYSLPPYDKDNIIQQNLIHIFDRLLLILNEMSKNKELDINFIESSKFSNYKQFYNVAIKIIAFNDLYSNGSLWFDWFYDRFNRYFEDDAIMFNPIGGLIIGTLCIWSGFKTNIMDLTVKGSEILVKVEPHLEFQFHHIISLLIINKLVETFNSGNEFTNIVESLMQLIKKFIQDYEIAENSMLFQKLNLYSAMLEMYTEMGVFIRKQNERIVPFDVFTWIFPSQLEEMSQIPWLPLNTSVENLNIG